MSEEIIKVLDDLSRRLGIVIDWSSDNMLPYLQDLISRIVTYEIYTSILWLSIFIIFIIVSLFLIRKFIFAIKNDESNIDIFLLIISVCLFFLAIGIFGSIDEINDIIEAKTIPEKCIIEHIQDLDD